MDNLNYLKSFNRYGVQKDRAYYIPFDEKDKITYCYGIENKLSSSRFINLNGKWDICQHNNLKEVDLNEKLNSTIDVPSCVQMNGYDHIQYINDRYPIPYLYPGVPFNNPCWHYRKNVFLKNITTEKFYLNFEGVDSCFYLYVNGTFKGYSQISHSTSEFDITNELRTGENIIDVIVVKWCISTYLECQDKFRFSGIFRNVYILRRPLNHITDYKIETKINGKDGIIEFYNEGKTDIIILVKGKNYLSKSNSKCEIPIKNVKLWSTDNPNLYKLILRCNGEKIIEKIGFRYIDINDGIFRINGEKIKLKGVNRHEFNYKSGATITIKDVVKDLKLMKELNVNAIRTSHYPNIPEFYKLCDYFGFYIMDECDLETHGISKIYGKGSRQPLIDFANDKSIVNAIYDREKALYERDKNRCSVIIWSLGNEASFGKAFYKGLSYIHKRDTKRPVHYENINWAEKKYYYTSKLDIMSMMYPTIDRLYSDVINNDKEKRPVVLCEYTHAMGNSCGDIRDYWDLIYSSDQLMGAFVWEWADHAIKTKKGLCYGGDFGEDNHDGNFCCDGLLTTDRKIKSSAREMQAVYGGKIISTEKNIEIPKVKICKKDIKVDVDENTGEINSICVNKIEILKNPIKFNIIRYIDNDRYNVDLWKQRGNLYQCKPYIINKSLENDWIVYNGVLSADTMCPAFKFTLRYKVIENQLLLDISYEVSDYVVNPPRFGIEFAINKQYKDFEYIGYGPYESYIDKHMACEYGYYKSNSNENYEHGYVRPQESGSHYATKYLKVNNLFEVYADEKFSFSINPYTTKQLVECKHDYELKENTFTNICIDLAICGIGSHSCGPEINEKYRIPKKFRNKFKFVF